MDQPISGGNVEIHVSRRFPLVSRFRYAMGRTAVQSLA